MVARVTRPSRDRSYIRTMVATVVLALGVLGALLGVFGEHVEVLVSFTTFGGIVAMMISTVMELRALDWGLSRFLSGEETPVSTRRYLKTGALIGTAVGIALLLVDALLLGA
jgi:hypothetical protein